jgi:hypothetical protein
LNRLQAELQRLYLPPAAGPTDPGSRALVLELARPASWDSLARVWRGVQADLDLPAPAIAVSGSDGYQLWFSCLQPVPVAQALGFLEALRQRYLGEVAPERIGMHPRPVALPPTEMTTGHWSAFVAPDLAAVFVDEPWIDLPPGADAQADLLSRLASSKPEAWQRALERLGPAAPIAPEAGAFASRPAPVAGGAEPRRFLLDVMNDRAIDLHLRIEAAKALLPYCDGAGPR